MSHLLLGHARCVYVLTAYIYVCVFECRPQWSLYSPWRVPEGDGPPAKSQLVLPRSRAQTPHFEGPPAESHPLAPPRRADGPLQQAQALIWGERRKYSCFLFSLKIGWGGGLLEPGGNEKQLWLRRTGSLYPGEK